jgi:DNA-binding response OmpR family regulator
MQTNGPILIVEDDANTLSLIKTYLEREGYETITAVDGEQALRLAKVQHPGFVVLDIMLPKMDGWEVCRQLRTFSNVPVLMLTAREEEIDRVTGLSLGADDYVVKPFSPRELVARIKAILRRFHPAAVESRDRLVCGGLEMDLVRHRVSREGKTIHLTASEYKLLQTLMTSAGRVFSRDELLEVFYQHGEIVVDRVVDVHIGKLRQKIEPEPADPRYILTVRGFGYTFTDQEPL